MIHRDEELVPRVRTELGRGAELAQLRQERLESGEIAAVDDQRAGGGPSRRLQEVDLRQLLDERAGEKAPERLFAVGQAAAEPASCGSMRA